MKFASFLRFFGERRQRDSQARRRRSERQRPGRGPVARLSVENLEERNLLAVLPPVVFPDASPDAFAPNDVTFLRGNENSPSLAVDPSNPDKAVAVYIHNDPQGTVQSQSVFLEGVYTTNGGQTWLPLNFGAASLNLFDPTSPVNGPFRLFAQVTDPTVSFDRNGNFYIASSQHLADNSAGAIVLHKFEFTGTDPNLLDLDPDTFEDVKVLYQWVGGDTAFTPTLAVDNTLATFEDPETRAVQTNPHAGTVYVAWSTNNVAPPNTGNTFNPNTIKLVASSDGGFNFTTQVYVNDSENFGGRERDGTPRLVVSQGTADPDGPGPLLPRVPGGQVTILWDDSNTFANANPPFSQIMSDRVTNGGVGAEFRDLTGGFIADAIDPGNSLPHIPVDSLFPVDVNIADPRFSTVTDVDVTVSLLHPNVEQLRLTLIPPPEQSGLFPIVLMFNRLNAAGQTIPMTGATGVNLGVINGNSVGMRFDDEAPRTVFQGAAPYIGMFQSDELLSALDGFTAADLVGTWTLQVTDFRTGGTTNPVPFLLDWKLNFTSALTPGFDTAVATTEVRGVPDPAVPAPFNGATTPASPDLGVGSGLALAADNTLGSFSPFQGRIYATYVDRINNFNNALPNLPDNTDIFLVSSDDGGLTWSQPLKVNDDDANLDGFSSAFTDPLTGLVLGGRAQFMPQAAVDPFTGTLVVSYFDGRYDAGRARVAQSVQTSIDGGQTFSQSNYANQPQTAFDAITGELVRLQPITDNQSANGNPDTTFGYGTHQGLAVLGGNVYMAWAGNQNGVVNRGGGAPRALDIFINSGTFAAGPRVLPESVTMGPVTPTVAQGFLADGTPVSIPYNNVFASDGSLLANAFIVEFDRPIDPNAFPLAAATVIFRSPTMGASDPGIALPILSVTDLNPSVRGTVPVRIDPVTGLTELLDTRFLVRFDPTPAGLPVDQGGTGSFTGTYSYSLRPTIRDRIRVPNVQILPGPLVTFSAVTPQVPLVIPPVGTGGSGLPAQDTAVSTIIVAGRPQNEVISDLNVTLTIDHTFTGDLDIVLIAPDGTRVPLALNVGGGNPLGFQGTVFDDQAPISINDFFNAVPPFTGPHRPQASLNAALRGKPLNGAWQLEITDQAGADVGMLLNWTLTIQGGTVSSNSVPGNRLDQNADTVPGDLVLDAFNVPTPATPGPNVAPFDPDTLPIVVPGPHIAGTSVPGQAASTSGESLVLNQTVTAIDLRFDRDMDPTSFTPQAVLRLITPAGVVRGPFTITPNPNGDDPDANFPRTYRVGFPEQIVSGTYTVELDATVRARNGEPIDTNQNAGVDNLRGINPNGAATANRIVSANVPVALAAAKTVVSTLVVPADQDFVIQGLTLQLNILFPNNPDLTATLIHPDGTRVLLFSGVGNNGTRSNFLNTIFDDNARDPQGNLQPVQNGISPFNSPGRYNPQTPLGVLVGKPAAGTYLLEIRNASATFSGNLTAWSLTFQEPVPTSGLGEPVADRATATFRIFTMATDEAQSHVAWTPVGPASINDGFGFHHAGRVTAMAVDPTDPTGNTVFIGAASGGVWRTQNFLTPDVAGPTWVPLTDFGPTNSLNIGSLTIFPRNNDPHQSIILAATGEGDSLSPGVGFLRSLDGGATWALLDSTRNVDASNNPLPISSTQRDRAFVGTTAFKVVADPSLTPTGNVIFYAALSDGTSTNRGGLYRSLDTGRTWTLLRAGQATDVVVVPGTASGSSGNVQQLYVAFQGEGVFITPNQGTSFNLLAGGLGNPLIRDGDVIPSAPVPVTSNAADTPNGAKGRIVLVAPEVIPSTDPNSVVKNLGYQGWLFALVSAATGTNFDGLYVTKDFGQNWTRIRFAAMTRPPFAVGFWPSNDTTFADFDADIDNTFTGLTIDPSNPNILYLGGATGPLRIDITALGDAHSLVPFDYDDPDGGALIAGTQGGISLKNANNAFQRLSLTPGGQVVETEIAYTNLIRDPLNPFLNNSTILLSNVARFNNNGDGATWRFFQDANNLSGGVHRLLAMRDPVTGRTRLLTGNDNGIYTAVDDGTGQLDLGVGDAVAFNGDRNGNLQIVQFNGGGVQPSVLAAEIAGSLFYGQSLGNGFPSSVGDVLTSGNIQWLPPVPPSLAPVPPLGTGQAVATDPTGSGTAYRFNWPCCGPNGIAITTDFFVVAPPGTLPDQIGQGRTNGLLQANNPGPTPDPQWPLLTGFNFAVNPLNGNQLVVSSASGQVFRTQDQGINWFSITPDAAGMPGTLDGSNANALAYGAPDPATFGGELDRNIVAGTLNGNVFVTFAGGGTVTGNPNTGWRDITGTGLDGSAIQSISTNPLRGSHEIYLVTEQGVYRLANAAAPTITWQNITGNLFNISQQLFGGFADLTGVNNPASGLSQVKLQDLTALAADWRYFDGARNLPPRLYVGGNAGVYASTDGGRSWSLFPRRADGAQVDGGFLANAEITHLDLSLGNINPTTGAPNQATGPNMLVATTFGRGTFSIRLDQNLAPGPQVSSIVPDAPLGPGVTSVTIGFRNTVDPSTFTPDDVRSFVGPNGAITVLTITDLTTDPTQPDAHTRFRLDFAEAQDSDGIYTLSIGPNVSDFAGNQMDQNGNQINGEDSGDRFNGRFVINSTDNGRFISGIFNDLLGRPANTDSFISFLNTLEAARFAALEQTATLFVTSDENRARLVEQFYKFPADPTQIGNFGIGNLLPGRATVTQEEINFWVTMIRLGTPPEALLQALAESDEYFERASRDNGLFVEQLYMDLLGRTAVGDSLAQALVDGLNNGTQSRSRVVASTLAGDEFLMRLVNNGFMTYLGRPASPGEFAIWLPRLRLPSPGPGLPSRSEQFLVSLVSSNEYFFRQTDATQLHTNAQWLTSIYANVLLRAPDASGFDFNINNILNLYAAQRQAQIQTLLGSLEYRQNQVRGYYDLYLGRTATQQEIDFWANTLLSGTPDEIVVAQFVSTPEYFNRTPTIIGLPPTTQPSNTTFVQALYLQILNRPGAAQDVNFWVAALQTGLTRTQVALAFLNSEERRAATITSYYQDFLNVANPPALDVAFWTNALALGVTEEQILLTFLTTPTYFLAPHTFP